MTLDATQDLGMRALAEAHDAKRWDLAVAVGDAWLEARSEMPALCAVWYAQSLMGVGRYDDALPWATIAAEKIGGPTLPEQIAQCAARATFAQALARVGLFSKARRVLKEMVAKRVEHPETLEKQGHTVLAISEKWRDGWAMHEQREHNATIPDGLTRWDGKTKGRVAVLHEQGIGDAILFARWLKQVAEISGEPVVWFGPENVLGRWMADLPHVIVGERGANRTPVDFAVFAMSLPHVLGCERKSDVPAPVAPASLRALRRRHVPTAGKLRVGVCWKGASTGWHDFERSFALEDFAPIWADYPGVEFVNLAHDAAILHNGPFGPAHFEDVYATGDTLVGLDLVVSVDTAVVHLAGSLGIPTLAIVPTVPDWRYAWPAGGTTPFYPSVTVLRRQRADDLAVITKARTLIERYAQALSRKAA